MAIVHGTNATETIDAADGVTNQKDVIFGLEGKDTIYGLGGDDIMKGGGGADTFYGGSGFDEVNYSDSTEGVTVSLDNGYTEGGTAAGDTFYSIENIGGSRYRDSLTGNGDPNTLRGYDGDDDLDGMGGPDILEGGIGEDRLWGRSGSDKLYGGDDDDYLFGGAGADVIDGGGGSWDTAFYDSSDEGVTVVLEYGLAYRGDAEGDTLSGIENVVGSDYDDILGGDDNANLLVGHDGNNVLKGYGGNDRLEGGNHEDRLIGGLGTDRMWGGQWGDNFVWTSTDETGVTEATADSIIDFVYLYDDLIDLHAIDADIVADGDQSFTFIGMNQFSGTPGEIRYYHAGGNTFIQLQTGTSADPEGVIRLDGIHTPDASWFVL